MDYSSMNSLKMERADVPPEKQKDEVLGTLSTDEEEDFL
jgi:hypothetical protein